MEIKKNLDLKLQIVDMTTEGSGIGKIDGMAVFVPGTAPGDIVTAHIIKVKKNYAIGKVLKINKPSNDRIENDCDCFPACGGCAYRHISYEAEKKIKQKRVTDAFQRIGKIDIVPNPILTGNTERYRNKAQFPVRMQSGKLETGFFAEKTHRIIPCSDCILQPAEVSDILNFIKKWLLQNPVSIYNEETGTGLVRHIYIRKAFNTGEIMVCIVINGEKMPRSDSLVNSLTGEFPQIETIVLNVNTENTNVILGKKCVNIYGDGYITDILCGKKFRISPLSFYQVNHDTAEILYEKAAEYAGLTGNETVIDLYCGAGTIGLTMIDKIKKLYGVEIVPEAIEDAKINAQINNADNAEFICSDAAAATIILENRGVKPDVLIVDPPRKGCDKELIETISRMNPEKVVYVSCDVATLARDAAIFNDYGYTVNEITPVDMFPRTVHTETVVLMTKNKIIAE